jgi:hypothetical protein
MVVGSKVGKLHNSVDWTNTDNVVVLSVMVGGCRHFLLLIVIVVRK